MNSLLALIILQRFERVNFTGVIIVAFIMCYITLMLADSQSEHTVNQPFETKERLRGRASLLGHVYITLRKNVFGVAEEVVVPQNNTQLLKNNFRAAKWLQERSGSRNWTNTVKNWQAGVKHTNYSYIINNMALCEGLSEPKMIVLVYSATNNFRKRASLRRTWADPRILNIKRFSVVFLLGTTEDKDQQRLIDLENERYKDIVMGDFLDSYQNLTHKGLFGFQWIMDFCQNARIVLKVDDDVFVNIFRLLESTRKDSFEHRQIACQVREIGNSPILREGRWKLDNSFFPGRTFYPFRHCNGYFVVMSLDVVKTLLEASVNETYLWIDDVYLYGLLPSKVNINIAQVMNILSLNEEQAATCLSNTHPCPLLMGYTYTDGAIERLWKLSLMNSFSLTENYSDLGYILTKQVSFF